MTGRVASWSFHDLCTRHTHTHSQTHAHYHTLVGRDAAWYACDTTISQSCTHNALEWRRQSRVPGDWGSHVCVCVFTLVRGRKKCMLWNMSHMWVLVCSMCVLCVFFLCVIFRFSLSLMNILLILPQPVCYLFAKANRNIIHAKLLLFSIIVYHATAGALKWLPQPRHQWWLGSHQWWRGQIIWAHRNQNVHTFAPRYCSMTLI